MFANGTTSHACDSDLGNVIKRLEHDSMLAIELFESNYMKLNEVNAIFFYLNISMK